MAWMGGQPRIPHGRHGRVTLEHVDDGSRVGAVSVHADGESLEAAEDEEAVEGPGDGADRVLEIGDVGGEVDVVDGDEPADDV